ncbi:MAG: 2-isopropylmalate synthase [Acidobacteria bacterium]|nr:2-isopropylmalate synthase [Acidobacteriota bacterium]
MQEDRESSARALIHDWNSEGGGRVPVALPELLDQTLRDGLQSPSVQTPSIAEQIELLHLMPLIGVSAVEVGLPAAGRQAAEQARRLVLEIESAGLPLEPLCAARTLEKDIAPILDIAESVGRPVVVSVFVGSSSIRHYAEGWEIGKLAAQAAKAVRFARDRGCQVMFVTEDTTRACPEHLAALYGAAIGAGAARICIADTTGHATPGGVRALVGFLRTVVARENPEVKIDWHGHQDRGLGVANALEALESGAHRVHGTALGVGERTGNAPLDQILVNLHLLGWFGAGFPQGLSSLGAYVAAASKALRMPIPSNYPVFGRDAFRTATGVHAAAILKARALGEDDLADRVYSAVPASLVGLTQQIEVGPMSGESNVRLWLAERGFASTPERIAVILERAKASDRVLSSGEILDALTGRSGEGVLSVPEPPAQREKIR